MFNVHGADSVCKPIRTVSILGWGFLRMGTLVLQIDSKVYLYGLREVPSDWGRAFAISKLDGVHKYRVIFDSDAPEDSVCECDGFKFRQACKHLAAIAALISHKKI